MIKNQRKVWAVAVSIAAIAIGVFPNPAKADGCVGDCQINRQPHPKPSCEVTNDCKSSQPGSLYDEIYSKHRPYCGYLRKHRYHSRHWSDNYHSEESLKHSYSKETAGDWDANIREDLIASRDGYSDVTGSSRYSGSDTMGGENALALFVVILLWFGFRFPGGKKDSK
ncbi:hypothetical protein ACL6C3_28810 [Capilliphycus salinus ALCB114379]|uniref:hypothetical protein n=1 Tax=Capilliphycus salinus TaxID=2768948 RepID=UPI0039A52542